MADQKATNPSRNMSNKYDRAGIRIPEGYRLALFNPFQKKNPKLSPDAQKAMSDLTDTHKQILNAPMIDEVFNISAYMTSTTYHTSPQYAMDQFNYLMRNPHKQPLISFDIESLGKHDWKPGMAIPRDIFTPTEVTFKKFGAMRETTGKRFKLTKPSEILKGSHGFNPFLSSDINVKRFSKFVPRDELSLIINPRAEVVRNLQSLIGDIRKAASSGVELRLSAFEKRSIIDLMKLSTQNVKSGEKLFEGAQYSTQSVGGMTLGRRLSRHGMFDVEGFEDRLYGMNSKQLAGYLGHAESGLNALGTYGVSAQEAVSRIAGFMSNNKDAVYLGANSINFDIPALRLFAEQLGVKLPEIERHLDTYHLTKSMYPNPADFYLDVRRRKNPAGAISRRGHESSYTLQSVLEELAPGTKQLHTSDFDTNIPVMLFNDPASRHVLYSKYKNMTKYGYDPSVRPTVDAPQYDPLRTIRKGSRLYVHSGYQLTDDEFSFVSELDEKGEAKKVYGTTAGKGFYDVQSMWKTTSPVTDKHGNSVESLFGMTLWDNDNQRTFVMSATSEQELAAKIQGIAVDADIYSPARQKELAASVQRDRARRRYEDFYSMEWGKGMTTAKRWYEVADLYNKEVKTGHLSEAELFDQVGFTKAQRRDFGILSTRLTSESSTMLKAISYIEQSVPEERRSMAWAMFNDTLPVHADTITRDGFNTHGISVWNRAMDAPTWLNMQSKDSISKSLFSVLKANSGGKHPSKLFEDASKESYLRFIMNDLSKNGMMSQDEIAQIQAEEGLANKVTRFATIFDNRNGALMPIEEQVQSIRARVLNIGDAEISNRIRGIASDLDSTMLPLSAKRADVVGYIKSTMERNRIMKEAKDEYRAQIANLAANLYESFSAKGVGVAFATVNNNMSMVLFNKENGAAVLNAMRQGKSSSMMVPVALPSVNKFGNIVMGNQEKLMQTMVRRKFGTNDWEAVNAIGLFETEMRKISNAVSLAISDNNTTSAISMARSGVQRSIKKLAGSTAWVQESELDVAAPSRSMNLSNVLGRRTFIVSELAKDIHPMLKGTDKVFGDLTDMQQMDFLMNMLPDWMGKNGKAVGLDKIYIHATKPHALGQGKIATADVRSWQSFGEFTQTTRENLIQFQNYYALNAANIMDIHANSSAMAKIAGESASGRNKWMVGSMSATNARLKAEYEISPNHATGISAMGTIMNDTDLDTLRQKAIKEAMEKGDMEVVNELSGMNLVRPRTYEQQIVMRRSLAEQLGGQAEKTIRFSNTDATPEFREMFERWKSSDGHFTLDAKSYGKNGFVFAKGQNYGHSYQVGFKEFRGGAATVMDMARQGDQWTVKLAYNNPAVIGAKVMIEGEKGTIASLLSDRAADYMFGKGNNISYAYWTNMAKHGDIGAYLSGMFNRLGYEAIEEGRVDEFTKAVRKNLGFNTSLVTARDDRAYFYLPKGYTNGLGKDAVTAMQNLYSSMGKKEMADFGQGVSGRVEMNEVRQMVVDEHLHVSDWMGRGRGASFGIREWHALEQQGLIFNSASRLKKNADGSSNLTYVGKWLDEAVGLSANHEGYVAQARGQYDTLNRLHAGATADSLSEVMYSRQFNQLPIDQGGLFTEQDLAGTIFDQSRYQDSAGRPIKGSGFWLDLGSTVDLDIGGGKTQSISQMWIGPQQVGRTTEGLIVLDEHQKALNKLLEAVEINRANFLEVDDEMKYTKEIGPMEAKSLIRDRLQTYAESIAEDLTSSSGTAFKKGLGGRLPTSGIGRVQIMSPHANAEINLGVAYMSKDRAGEMFGNLDRLITDPAGKRVRLGEFLRTEGIYGLGQRFPNIHSKTIQALNFRISDEVEGHNLLMDAATAHMFNADTDGDITAFSLAYNKHLNPFGRFRRDFWETQAELKAAVNSVNWVSSTGSTRDFHNRGTLLKMIQDDDKYTISKMATADNILGAMRKQYGEVVNWASDDLAVINGQQQSISWSRLNDEMVATARETKKAIGKFSNLSSKIRDSAASVFAGDAETFTRLEEFGRILEQNVISYKHVTGGSSFLQVVNHLYDSLSGSNYDEAATRRHLQTLLGDKNPVQVYTQDENGIKPAFGIDEMLSDYSQLRARLDTEYTNRSKKIGLSTGPMDSRAGISGVIAAMDEKNGEYIVGNKLSVLEMLDSQIAQSYQATNAGRQTLPNISLSGAPLSAEVSEVASNAVEEAVSGSATIGSDMRKNIGDAVERFTGGMSPGAKVGVGIVGGIMAMGLAVRAMTARNSDVAPEDRQSAPVMAPTGESVARVAQNRPGGMRVTVKATGQMPGTELAGHVNTAVQANIPVELRTNVSVNDNTSDFDQGYLRDVFSRMI